MKTTLLGIMICLFLSTACSSYQENNGSGIEPETITNELSIVSIKQLSFYLQRDSTDFYFEDPVATLLDDMATFDKWNEILSDNCETHRPNHPSYDKTYIVVATSEEGEPLYYYLRVDSDDSDNIDFLPLRVEEGSKWTQIYEQGIYRCEGLKELVEEIIQ